MAYGGFARAVSTALFALLFSLAGSVVAEAAPETWVVDGRVTGEDAAGGVANADVFLDIDCYIGDPADTCYSSSTKTDAQGHFTFPAVPRSIGQAGATYGITVYATGYAHQGKSVPQGQNATLAFNLTRQITCTVGLVGDFRSGSSITAVTAVSPSVPTDDPSFIWVRAGAGSGGSDDVAINGVYGATYKLTDADVGHAIYVDGVVVSAERGAAQCTSLPSPVVGSAMSPPTAALVPVSGSPSVSGKAKVGKVLTASPGSAPVGTAVAYQWFRIRTVMKHHRTVTVAIAGATRTQYKVRKKDKTSRLYARMILTKSGYAPRTEVTKPVKIH